MTKFEINYQKIKKIDLEHLDKMEQDTDLSDKEVLKNRPFHIRELQCYNPIYSIFFELNPTNYDSIALNHHYFMYDLTQVIDKTSGALTRRDVFIKFAPLLDPIRYLIGKYKSRDDLKVLPSYKNKTHDKLNSPNNASYVDNFFCYLSSQLLNVHRFTNAIDYYGSFLGIQEKYKMNVADDIEYLIQSEYFMQNKGKVYEIEEHEDPFANFGSRKNKNKLMIHGNSNISAISLEEIIDIEEDINTIDHIDLMDPAEQEDAKDGDEQEQCIYEKSMSENSDTSSIDSSNNSCLNYSDDDDDDEDDGDDDDDGDDEDDDEDDNDEDEGSEDADDDSKWEDIDESTSSSSSESDEIKIDALIYDFPVQMICLEKCKGTLDELFVKHTISVESASSALFQIIMTLIAYQKAFHFTHNDLHTNNIMFVDTDKEYITYKYSGEYYRVPTYGKIFKIIDYGRAIYRFQGKIFCSDSFAPGGDAATQYNTEPYFNDSKPRLEPNYSFDLCRLGCSIYDFILEIDDELASNELDDLQKTVIRWVSDDNGKNVIYKKNGDERYPNFKLYKMIARTVNKHTPESQLNYPYFMQFKYNPGSDPGSESGSESGSNNDNTTIIDLDAIPVYV